MKEHKTIVDDNGNEIKIYPEMLATKEARKFFGLKLRPYEKEFPKIGRTRKLRDKDRGGIGIPLPEHPDRPRHPCRIRISVRGDSRHASRREACQS